MGDAAPDDIFVPLDTLADEVKRTPRLSRDSLGRILAHCYALGLRPMPPATREAMLASIKRKRASEGANRSYVQKSTETPHTLIMRYVFPSKKENTNSSRYSLALNWLAEQKVPAGGFAKAVRENGGLTMIYWKARDRLGKPMTRNKLALSTNLTVTAGRPFTLRLMPKANGLFDVLEVTHD